MKQEDYKYILINGINIAYTDRGSGRPIVFVHGFASFSFTWFKLIENLPDTCRFITLDLKGSGYSEKAYDDNSPFSQSIIVKEFIAKLDLNDIILVGHSMGGEISILSLFDDSFREKVSALILIDSAGLFEKVPGFVEEISRLSPDNPIFNIIDDRELTLYVLFQIFYDKDKITEEVLSEYSNLLSLKNYKNCLISAAKHIGIANERFFRQKIQQLQIPSLVIWGEKDEVINVSDADIFRKDLKAELVTLPECGHSPQEEMPVETGAVISKFLRSFERNNTSHHENDNPSISKEKKQYDTSLMPHQITKLKMRTLVDRWSLGSILLILIIKILQGLRVMGLKTKENGWRIVTGTFLRNEQSKFMLASFRLDYSNGFSKPANIDDAKLIIIKRLSEFLRKTPATHWALSWSLFKTKRAQLFFTDIVEAEFEKDGHLKKLTPYFDQTRPTFSMLTDAMIQETLNKLMVFFNYYQSGKKSDHLKAWLLLKKLLHWSEKTTKISHSGKQELKCMVRRILNASLIHFDTVKSSSSNILSIERLKVPNTRLCKHPGFGLLNIKCRFIENLSECDMWVQYHHVPVDGLPMQEIMQELKKEFGEKGGIKYPSLSTLVSKPETFYFGNKLFRARIFVNFEKFMRFRKYLNTAYYNQLNGTATVASLVIWGISQQKFFNNLKYLFPVDTRTYADFPKDRNLSILAIRPKKFFNSQKPFEGFLKYQHEFNRKLFLARIEKNETHEFFELISMLHPSMSYIFNKIFPRAIGEAIGTSGITILKDAEMFVTPSTDIQRHGFIAIGKMNNLTEDGRLMGTVNICGNREQIHEYIIAVNNIAANLPKMLNIPFED